MNQPWVAEKVITEKEAVVLIEKQFPELKPVKVVMLGKGFDNTVLLVNDRYVFRFPRRELAADLILTENRILPLIAPLMPIPIPNPRFQGTPFKNYPWPFSGCDVLPGKTPRGLTPEQRVLSVAPLAQLLRGLHDFPLSEVEDLSIPEDELGRIHIPKRKPMMEANIDVAREKGLIDQSMLGQLQSFLSAINTPLTDQTKTLVHGDLHTQNMLVDDSGRISAVIDWGDMHLGHPAVDLSIVYSYFPPEGRKRFFELYGDVSPEIKKIARFKAIYTILMLLLYAEDKEDALLIDECQFTLLLALKD